MQQSLFPKNQIIVMDGAMGTMLQQRGLQPGEAPERMNLRAPEVVTAVHRAYAEAGSHVVSTNTFGANRRKLGKMGLSVDEVVRRAVEAARAAVRGTEVRVALDIGPIGELLEPSGELTFEEAYEIFAEMAEAGQRHGADLILIETMTDLYEARAALLAAKERTDLPVWVSMSFEQNGRTLTGTPVTVMAMTLGAMGADAVGINCSLGPEEMVGLARELCANTSVPVFLKPNAGLPDAVTGEHRMAPDVFAGWMQVCALPGVAMMGGCCGTNPETIKALAGVLRGRVPLPSVAVPQSRICSSMKAVSLDGPLAVGERINPTGKDALIEELSRGEFWELQDLVMEQEEEGAAFLDVNVAIAGGDEKVLLPAAIKDIQALTRIPLQLDSSDLAAMEAGLRVYNGKSIINSVTAAPDRLDTAIRLCQKYGAAFVGLTMNNKGIPESVEERVALAEGIIERALAGGVPREDIIIDCITMPVLYFPDLEEVTLGALAEVKRRWGIKTMLGISNISFGMANLEARRAKNREFLGLALEAGLDLSIVDPGDAAIMELISNSK